MTQRVNISRRGFIKTGIALAAAPLIVPARVFGANDRLGIGFIAVGRRGLQLKADFLAVAKKGNAQIVAVSDLYKKRMDAVCKDETWGKYQDYKDLLQDKNVDAVIVSTPDHWHTLPSIHACQAGKDVYCEKPLTLTIKEGRALVTAARKYNRIVQTGSQQRSDDKCRLGCELIRNGRLGKVSLIHTSIYPSPWECTLPEEPAPDGLLWDVWCGQTQPRPFHKDLYLPRANPGWISFRPYSGGEMTGWGAHGLDILQWAMGMDNSGPVEVWAEEGKPLERPVVMRYANGTIVRFDEKEQTGGGLFEGENGKIRIDRGKMEATPKDLAKEPLKDSDIHLYKSENHMLNWLQCIRTRELPVADVEIGHRSATMCHLGNIARWTGRKMHWDPEKEVFVNDEDANTYIERPMREPYGIPKDI